MLVRTRNVIDTAGADAVIAAAEAAASEQGSRVYICVVDPSGEVVAMRRTPGAQVASARVAVDKARTAAIFVRPSREMEDQVTGGRLGALALHGASCLTGGIPLKVGDEVVGAVGAAAQQRGVAPVVSAVDAGGELMYLVRPDAAQVASVQVTTDKARTAAIYRRPSRDFEEQASGGRPSALHLARAVPLQGGIPLTVDGEVIGAIGVSGATSADEDQELALIGAEAFSAAVSSQNGGGNGAAFFPKAKLQETFETGGLLLETPGYKIDAG